MVIKYQTGYVDDHSVLLFYSKKENNYRYNITNQELTNIQIVKKICKILDKKIPQKKSYKHLISFVKDRPGHDFRYSINSKKIFKNLGWKNKIQIDNGLESIADFYIQKYKNTKIKKSKKNFDIRIIWTTWFRY